MYICIEVHRSCVLQFPFPLHWYLCKNFNIQGDPKKTIHSVLYLRSVVEVQFYFFTGVSEPEFRARFTWSPYWCPFRIRKASKMPSHTQFSLYLHSLGDSEVLLFLPSSPDNAPVEVWRLIRSLLSWELTDHSSGNISCKWIDDLFT